MPLFVNHLTRRAFLRNTALIGAATALSARSWAQVPGASTDLRVAVIGLNGRGKGNHIPRLQEIKGVRIVALCDPDTAVLERAAKLVPGDVQKFTDVRELLAMKDLDVVTIATPNHWHSLGAIWACQAGKDVYVEKPVSHNVWEGRQLVAAAQKYGRAVQAGTQIRSGDGLREAVAWTQAGNLGKITAARGFCYKARASIGKTSGRQELPSTVDYNLWSGPAPAVELHRKRLHYDWHWDYLTGNGDVGNQGIHQMDVARWFLGESGMPRHTLSIGGRLGYEDDGNTPNTQVVVHDYATAPLIFEVRGLPAKAGGAPAAAGGDDAGGESAKGPAMDKYAGVWPAGKNVGVGNVIDCEGGYIVIPSYTQAMAYDKKGTLIKQFDGKDTHMKNFIEVVRSRKMADLRGPVLEGHLSSALCHLGNISHQLGKAATPDALKEKIRGNAPLAEAYGRMEQHLGANGVNLKQTPPTLGVLLTLEAGKESFTGADAAAANALLTREYRAPFVVPKIV
jgi:predicted dehydrogenase